MAKPPVLLPGNPMDRGPWRATVHSITELDTTEQLSSLSVICKAVCFIYKAVTVLQYLL